MNQHLSKCLLCRFPTLFGTLFKAADLTFLLVGGKDVNLLNIIANTVPTHFFKVGSCNPQSTFISARWFGSKES